MTRAVILSAVRTPVGRYGGGLAGVRPDDLAAIAVREAVARAGVPAEEIEDVWLGCANQAGEDNRNVARMAVLLAGLPESVAGVTVNRLCASGLAAIVGACQAVLAGGGDLFVAGGVESMSRAPLVTAKPDAAYPRGDRTLYDTTLGWRFPNPRMEELFPLETMGETGENVADRWGVSREEQDAFALRSHQRAHQATLSGAFKEEIVPVQGHDEKGALKCCDTDEVIRPDTTLEALSGLKPAFDAKNGTITAGNASAVSDGAAGLLVMSAEKAKALGKQPLAKVVSMSAVGVDPSIMGYGPVPAVKKALDRVKMKTSDVELYELNEAFAAQSLPVLKDLDLLGALDEKVNLHGGAIALGHPLGCSGARIMTTLLHQMKAKHKTTGVATMCIGFGQGVATVFERA
jgi:3-oxoadipyl-CoA thiolase